MELMINISNDTILFGIYENNELLSQFSMQSNPLKSMDEYGKDVYELVQLKGFDPLKIEGALIASVVVGLDTTIEHALLEYFNFDRVKFGPHIQSNIKKFGPHMKTGVQIKIDHPKSLGSDILIGAYSANLKYPGQDLLIINFGSVSTFSIITKEKALLGGSIIPGVDAIIDGMLDKIPNLPMFSFELTRDVINNNTSDALKSGLVFGYIGMVDGMIEYILEEFNQPLSVVLTGKQSFLIHKLLKHECLLEENLILDGLNHLYTSKQGI